MLFAVNEISEKCLLGKDPQIIKHINVIKKPTLHNFYCRHMIMSGYK